MAVHVQWSSDNGATEAKYWDEHAKNGLIQFTRLLFLTHLPGFHHHVAFVDSLQPSRLKVAHLMMRLRPCEDP